MDNEPIPTTVTQPAPVNATAPAAVAPTTATPSAASVAAVNNPPVQGDDSAISFDQFEAVRDSSQPAVATPTTTTQATMPVTTATTASPTPTIAAVAPVAPVAPVVLPAPNKDELPSLDLELIGDAKTLPVTTPVVAKVIEGRDYTGLEDNEVDLFKKMSNESFAVLKPAYMESKQLKPKVAQMEQELKTTKEQLAKVPTQGQLPDHYYEHPASFVLNPDYLAAQGTMQNMGIEKQHWTRQLELIEGGKKPHALVRNQDGSYYEGQELAPTAATKAQIMSNISLASQYEQQAGQMANGIAQQHASRYQREMTELVAFENKTFPWFVEGKEHPYKDFITKSIQQAPPLLRANPVLARMYAKSQALFQDMQKQIKLLKQPKAPTVVAQQPLATTAGGGAPGQAAQPDVTMDDFEKLKYA